MKKIYIWLLLGCIAFLQVCLLISFQNVLNFLSPSRIITLVAIEFCVGLMIFAALSGRFASFSITIWMLLLANFALTPIELKPRAPEHLSLPPNLNYKLEIIGDAMPGFSGVQHVSTDELGYRVTKKIDYANKGSAFRIFTIGGSTTEEIYTDNQKTWSAQLEANLTTHLGNNVEVINTGFAGLRAAHHLKTLKHVLQYKPDAVVFMMGINDWNHHVKAAIQAQQIVSDNAAAENTKKADSNTAVIRDAKPSTSFIQKFDITKSLLWKSVQRVAGKELITKNDGSYYYNQNHSVNRSDWRRLELGEVAIDYRDIVDEIISRCNSARLICLFVNQATAYQPGITSDLTRRLWMTPPNEPYSVNFDDIRRIAQTYNQWLIQRIPDNSCDVSLTLPATTDYLIDDCHFNPKGSALIADKISHCLTSKFNLKR